LPAQQARDPKFPPTASAFTSTNRLGLHTIRNIFHFTGQNLWFYALIYIPLSQLFAFEFTNPLWIAILAPFLLGETMTRTRIFVSILFWLTVLQGLFGILCAGYDGDIAVPPTDMFHWVAIVGFGGLLAHYSITTALKLAPASVVAPLEFLRLPLIAVVGFILYDEPILATVFIGAIIVFGANFLNIREETRANKARRT